MNRQRIIGFAIAVLGLAVSSGVLAAPPASADLIRARQLFFGIENVDATTGAVDNQKVVFSWITNASYAVSLKGRIVLLDTYVHRGETQPGRTPFVVQDLVSLQPEAIFLGHGHFDHADNAAFVAGSLGIPIYASEETCAAMQTDASNLFNAGKISVSSVDCRVTTTKGSTPGAEIVTISQLEPVACITAFRHLHSTTVPADPTIPIVQVMNIADPRDPQMYPPGTALTYPSSGSGGPGGPISIFYQFVMRGDNRFTFVWHNTTGAIKEGCSLGQVYPSGCWGPTVGQHLIDIMKALPPTDVELGSMVSLGYPTNGMRDVVFYNEAIQPKVYIPIHQTNAALPTSSLEFKVSYLKQLNQMVPPFPPELQPEARWMVDPDDYVKPLVYDPKDPRWTKRGGSVGACK
ncbi:MAG TPA: MBL fold metallo-hydrolase [Casimicrobiaceae bacterium]|nr:MBL fold metallo-hydrolase [Casimicrobiaceae bacterium]